MKRPHEFQTHGFVELTHRGPILLLVAKGITGGKQMAGIDAHAEPPGVLDAVENAGQVLEAPTETRPLAGRVLQQALSADAARLAVDFIQRPDNSSDAGRLAGRSIRA